MMLDCKCFFIQSWQFYKTFLIRKYFFANYNCAWKTCFTFSKFLKNIFTSGLVYKTWHLDTINYTPYQSAGDVTKHTKVPIFILYKQHVSPQDIFFPKKSHNIHRFS